jgi:CubicO group peptidase (beta-lactamase class C family)
MKITCLITCLFLSIGLTSVRAQNPGKMSTVPADSIYSWLKSNHVPAVAIGIIENNRIKSVDVYGELTGGVKAPLNAYWNVASLTKPVTALTVLALVDQGKWDLDEPVSKYWIDPDIKDDPRTAKLTIRILLSHSAGFPNWRFNAPGNKLFFRFEPGTGFSYSGEGYEYIRRALESKFHRSLQQLAEEELFLPAKMKDTRYSWDEALDSTRFALPHDPAGNRIYNTKSTTVIAADWLITTISDYTLLGLYTIKGAGLSKPLYTDMTTIHTHFDTTAAHRNSGMGLGWQVVRNLPGNEFVLAHGGSDDGVRTDIILLPASGRGIIVFTNGDNGSTVINNIMKSSLPDLRTALSPYMGEFK